MSTKTRLGQLESYRQSWQQGGRDPDLVYAIMANIGYLRREGLGRKQMRLVRSIEIEMRNQIKVVLPSLQKFLTGTTLPERSLRLQDNDDMLVDFFQDRDDAELAWQLAWEYADEEEEVEAQRGLSDLRRVLDQVDDNVLLDADLVKKLREIGSLDPLAYFDLDFYWWLPGDRGECELPSHRRDQYMAQYIDKRMPAKLKTQYQRHLLQCAYCREQVDKFRV